MRKTDTRPRRKIAQGERLFALEAATELLNTYVAARKSAADKAIEAVTMAEKMQHLSTIEQYDDAISKLILIREVVDNSMHLARRLGQLLPGREEQGTPRRGT
jgi:hypothetical protein